MFLRWSKDDRDKATWEYTRSLETCGSCGTRQAEFADDRDAWVPETVRCRGCELREVHEAALDRQKLGKGIQVRLVRREAVTGG